MVPGDQDRTKTVDGTSAVARLAALLVIIICLAILAFYHRNDLLPAPEQVEVGLNPEFVKCRDERTAQVAKMRTEGLIGDEQVATFTERALAYCTSTFPPDAAPSDQNTAN